MKTITAKYEWYGKTKTMQLTPHNYGYRFQYDGVTYQIERDAKRNSRWNVYRVTYGSSGGARLAPVIQLAVSRKQAIADTLFQTIVEELEDEAQEATAAVLPSAEHRPVPDSSSNDYSRHHAAIYADPRLTDIDAAARYTSATSTDNGASWTPDPMPEGWYSVCGGHVQCEVAGALGAGWDVVADGTTRIIRNWDGSLTRWTLIVLTDEETAVMEAMIRQSRARAH
ncbi:hypothetical protein ACIGMX_34580 [Streptomyces aquilus]|uniref:hypothetical protein n=1 Tax=Streptomyces aquilus TaxID=2548456 RepID=UPI0037D88FD7